MSKINLVDYFCGSGGFSKGFSEVDGFNIMLGIDNDKNSVDTFKSNHSCQVMKRDISNLDPEEVENALDSKPDLLIGGPPCQGFSIAGDRNEDDSRNTLFLDFAENIEFLDPEVFIMENVPGLLSMDTSDGNKVISRIQEVFQDLGYNVKYKKLKASDYGTPQHRERVFIIGSKNKSPRFPDPTHGTKENLKSYLTVKDAISDLPSLRAGEDKSSYEKLPENSYQKAMRRKVDKTQLENHSAVNHRDHIVERFKHIPQGGNMSDAPEDLQPNKIYESRNRRLKEDEPSYTVTSHVLDELLHPWDDRSITVREAARLQGFPDDYVFKGSRNVFHGSDETSQYEQVGNAVPVCMSKSIAESVKIILEN